MSEPGCITGYKVFCERLKAGDAKARLLLLVQNFYLRSIVPDPWSGEGLLTDVDSFLTRIAAADRNDTFDRLDHIDAHTKDAVNYLLGHLHEEIVRMHDFVPISSVREVDMSTLIWLTRLPGRTVKEKLAGKRRIKAVARNWLRDTLENRLFKAFLQNLRELKELKEKSLGVTAGGTSDNLTDAINSWLNGDGREIGRYDHLPPNNRLLSDKQYRKIWDAWNWLGDLDRLVARDADQLDARVLEAVFWELAAILHANAATALIQLPVETHIRRLEAHPLWPKGHPGRKETACLMGIVRGAKSKGFLSLKLSDGKLEFRCGPIVAQAVCRDGKTAVTVEWKTKTYEKTFSGPASVVEAARYLGQILATSTPRSRKKMPRKSPYVAADIARIRPRLSAGDGTPLHFDGRLLGQYVDCGSGRGRVFLNCGTAKGLLFSGDTRIIRGEDIFRNDDAASGDVARAAESFFEMLANQVECRIFQFIAPDDIDDFSLNLSRRQANLHFQDARTLPRSIGALFDYIQHNPGSFSEDECLVIVGSLLGTHVTLTPLLGHKDQNLLTTIPESGGFRWERHPSITFPAKEIAKAAKSIFGEAFASIPGADLFSPEDIRDCAEQITLFYNAGDRFLDFPLGAAERDAAEKFLNYYKLRLGISRFYKLPEQARGLPCYYLAADCPIHRVEAIHKEVTVLGAAVSVRGAAFLASLEAREECPPLWRDHIPDLFMRVSIDHAPKDIPLVKDNAILPRYGETKIINKGIHLDLPHGVERYHFPLTKEERGSKMRYEALIQSPYFPLSSDLPCTLKVTYTYGAENPFQLWLLPDGNSGWRHGPLRAEWVNASDIRRESPVPVAPPVMSWADLRHLPGPRGDQDMVQRMINGFDFFHYLREMCSFWEQRHLGSKSLADYRKKPFKRVYITGFKENATWKTNDKGESYCLIPFKEDSIAKKRDVIYFNEKYWIDKNISIKETDDVVCDVYKYDNPDKYHAKNIHAGNISFETYEEQFLKAIGFPAVQIWRDGRSLSDADAPQELRIAAARFIEDIEYFRTVQVLSEPIQRGIYLCAARMHRDGPPWLRKSLLERISEHGRVHKKSLLLGSLLGDLSLEEQRQIHHKILMDCCVTKPDSIAPFKALALAWWRVPAIIHAVSANDLAALANGVTAAFSWVLDRANQSWVDEDATVLCELVLAMLRTRGSKNPEICSILDANGKAARNLTEKIEELINRHAKKPLSMKSYLQLDVNKPAAHASLPDLLYATHMYLTGESGAGDIIITGFDEG